MTTFDRVKELADKRKISLVELEDRLDFGKNSLYRWKTSAPASDKLQKVADYFEVSTDYLLGREVQERKTETDLSKMLDNAMSFDGKPMSDHDREIIMAYLEGKFAEK